MAAEGPARVKQVNTKGESSLHCNFSVSFCSFLYNGVYFDGLKLFVSDVIFSQKGSNGDGKLQCGVIAQR